jgi:uncharacterized protein (TIGR02301 family)
LFLPQIGGIDPAMIRRALLACALALVLAAPAAAQGLFQQLFPPRDIPLRGAPPPPPPRDFFGAPRPVVPRSPGQPKAALRGPQQVPPRIEGAPPPYEGEMARLSEILGALHYLRPLCGASVENGRWRGEMEQLLEAEQPAPERRGRMIASFNRGYFTYEQTYRSCTDAAGFAIDRFLGEGARLSRDIATRYSY